MPDLKFSDDVVQNGLIGVLGLGSTAGGYKDNGGLFYLMKGTIPTQGEFDNLGSNWRSTDRLWTDSNIDNIVTLGANTISISFRNLNAIATGTATWFYWDGESATNSSGTTARLLGSITVTGGGGDLTMGDVNLVSGQPYAIGPIVLTIPALYTYT